MERHEPMLLRWLLACVGMIGFIYAYDPGRAFEFINRRPDIWFMMMFVYPIMSALPQEFIFCTYFFKRFQPLFPKINVMIIASAIVFAYAHVLFWNWVAPPLSLIAGFIFASTYAKTKSLALVSIEHALYGNAMFTIGLGWYFYGGAAAF